MALSSPRVLLLADDLTGAADAGIAFAKRGLHTMVALDGPGVGASGQVAVVDLDTRDRRAGDVGERVRLAAAQQADIFFLKLDSLLRGPVTEALTGLLRARPDSLLLLAPALPALGRTTVDGVQLVDGRPTACSLADALGGMSTTTLDLRAVRGHLSTVLSSTTTPTVVLDAQTDLDLERIVAAATASGRAVSWAGTAGLAGAVAASIGMAEGEWQPAPATIGVGATVSVIGSATSTAATQADSLAAGGATAIRLSSTDLLCASPADLTIVRRRIAEAVGGGDVVVSVQGSHLPTAAGELLDRLTGVVADAVARAGLLILTGGATARAVLTSRGVKSLQLCAELEPGVVLSQAAGHDFHVITKSGSFGDAHTLTRAAQAARRGAHT